jgi:low affinity Fe/Cu permease
MHKNSKSLLQRWEQVAQAVTEWSGKPLVFGVALLTVVVWAVTGPLFNFSDTWQLVINTGTTIVTFLMVFLIQQTQNKDTQALELKLNEIVAAVAGASNRLIDVESLTSAELMVLRRHYRELADMAQEESSVTKSHSVEEAVARHKAKQKATR